MAGIQTTGPASPSTVNIQAKQTLTITGAIVGTAETSIVIPLNVKSFRIKTKKGSAAVLTIAASAGGTASSITSWDIAMGSIYQEEFLTGTSALTLYIKSSKASTDVQILYWT